VKVVVRQDSGNSVTLLFSGTFDETSSFDGINVGKGKKINLDIGNVEHINSTGCRIWGAWIHSLDPSNILKFVNCSSLFWIM